MPRGTDIFYISGTKRGPNSRKRIGGSSYPVALMADDVPNPDEWGPDNYWTAQAYIDWFTLNENLYGLAVAKNKMLQAIDAWTFAGAEYDYCYNSAFNNFFTGKGIDVTTLFCRVLNAGGQVIDDTVQVVTNTTGTASGLTSFIKAVSPFLLLGAVVYGISEFALPAAKRLKEEI